MRAMFLTAIILLTLSCAKNIREIKEFHFPEKPIKERLSEIREGQIKEVER